MGDDFWSSNKTPWEAPGEVVVWAFGMILAAFLLHNLIRSYKEKS